MAALSPAARAFSRNAAVKRGRKALGRPKDEFPTPKTLPALGQASPREARATRVS